MYNIGISYIRGDYMNWNQIQYIVSVVENGSISVAARKLYISQPSLSLSIQALEKELGEKIFYRNRGHMTLTYAGKIYYEWAKTTFHSYQQMMTKMEDVKNESCRLIRIGISPHRTGYIMPTILSEFYKRYPKCEIQIVEQPTYHLRKLLEQNEIDFMIDIPHPDSINYESEVLTEEKIILAVPNQIYDQILHDNNQEISLQMLWNFPFIMMSKEHVIGEITHQMCETSMFIPNTRLTCTTLDSVIFMVKEQIGIAFVPEIYRKKNVYEDKIKYLDLSDCTNTRKICLVHSKKQYQFQQITYILELLRQHISEAYCNHEDYLNNY